MPGGDELIGLPWFSKDLTNLIHPMVPGRVHTILAPTGTGKTLFDLNVVSHLLEVEDEARVMVAATEETPRYLDLLACRAAGVSFADHFYRKLSEEQSADVARWRAAYAEHTQLQVLEQGEPTLQDIVDAMEKHGVPHVLVVDHLHCMDAGGRPLPAFLDLAMSVLKDLTQRLNLISVLFAQVHRPHSRDLIYPYRTPSTTSGLGSSKIEQASDVLLGLSRKLRDDMPKDARLRLIAGLLKERESIRDYEDQNTMRVTVLKHRLDDEARSKSILLGVGQGRIRDRIRLMDGTTGAPLFEEQDDRPPF